MGNECCAEPSLDELFRDPAMQVLLRRDGVTENDIWALLCTMKEARAVAMRVAERRPVAPKSAAHMPDRRETVISSRAARSPEAGENMISEQRGILLIRPMCTTITLAYQASEE